MKFSTKPTNTLNWNANGLVDEKRGLALLPTAPPSAARWGPATAPSRPPCAAPAVPAAPRQQEVPLPSCELTPIVRKRVVHGGCSCRGSASRTPLPSRSWWLSSSSVDSQCPPCRKSGGSPLPRPPRSTAARASATSAVVALCDGGHSLCRRQLRREQPWASRAGSTKQRIHKRQRNLFETCGGCDGCGGYGGCGGCGARSVVRACLSIRTRMQLIKGPVPVQWSLRLD